MGPLPALIRATLRPLRAWVCPDLVPLAARASTLKAATRMTQRLPEPAGARGAGTAWSVLCVYCRAPVPAYAFSCRAAGPRQGGCYRPAASRVSAEAP